MSRKELKNKPLVEAIVEIRWLLPDQGIPGIAVDPYYRLLLGRFSERVEKDYPAHEALQTASIPDGMVPHVVQHRFRAAKDSWPLVQLGPGIMTVNDTAGYKWEGFQEKCEKALDQLFEAHPSSENFKIQDIVLRYIDAVAFNLDEENIFKFLREKMKIGLALPDNLFADTKISKNPSSFNWQASFSIKEPEGMITMRFANGVKDDQSSLIWETIVHSSGTQIPKLPDGFSRWLHSAHNVTDDWFFKLIEGELERGFSGE